MPDKRLLRPVGLELNSAVMERGSGMSAMEKPLKKKEGILHHSWNALEIWISFICMSGALILCFTQVIVRYVFQSSISWSEEIAKWFVVWLTFAGSAYAFKVGAHIGVEAFVSILPAKPRRIVQWIADILTIVFVLLMIFYGTLFLGESIEMGQVAPASRLPMAIAYAALPIGFSLVLFRLLYMKFVQITGRE